MKRKYKKLISTALSLSILTTIVQLPAKAEPTDVHIPEIQIGEDILSNDVFYLASANAQLNEGENERYLLRLARGGDCTSKSGVTVKISDLTAKYGKDYTISLYGSDVSADNPKDNQSFLEQINGQEYTETPVYSDEEYAEMLKNDEELQAKTTEALQDTIDYWEESSGLMETEAEISEEDAGSVKTNPIHEAREKYTGIQGEEQRVTSTTDTMQEIQQMANVLTDAVVGANITVDFEEGESEKYIVIDVNDNHQSDGDRYFYLMLAAPYGTTTNSAASSCAVTIADDEEKVLSEVGFAQTEYRAAGESVTVEVQREGAANSVVSAHLTVEGGKAMIGRDVSEVDMDVVFPFGVNKRTIEIPIRTEYITGEADFTLRLENANECELTADSAVVTIEGTGGKIDNNIELMEVTEDAVSLDKIILGDEIDLKKPEKLGNGNDFSGDGNHYDNEKPQWYMRWNSRKWGNNQPGSVGASWNISKYNGADIAGVQIDWAKIGNKSEISAAFVGSGSRNEDWAFSNDAKCYKNTAAMGDGTKTNIFGTFWDPVRVSVFNDSEISDGDRLWIHSIRPIYRPFVIQFEKPDSSFGFLTGEDDKKDVFGEATAIEVVGSTVGDDSQQIIRNTNDRTNSITIRAKENYAYLSGIKIVKDGKAEIVESWADDGQTSRTFDLTSEKIDKWSSYINFSENKVSDTWKNPSNDKYGWRGNIKFQPVFSYRKAIVKVKEGKDDFGYFTINGKAVDPKEYEYHRGDVLKLSIVMRDEYKDLYEPAGYKLIAKTNASNSEKSEYTQNLGTGETAYLNPNLTNKHLESGYYEITPIFKKKDNPLVVRVKSSDVDKFDHNYGLFRSEKTSVEITENGVQYIEYIINNNPIYGKIYSMSARLAENASENLYINWNDPMAKSNNYCGETFYHEITNEKEDNIITLSCIEGKSDKEIYQSFSGKVYRPRYNMRTKIAGQDLKDPAEGAIISIGGVSTTVDSNGNFKTSPVKALNGQYSDNKNLCARCIVSIDGVEVLKDIELKSQKTKEEEVSVITEKNGKNQIEHTKLWIASQKIEDIDINTENSSIIGYIDVYTDKTGEGSSIIIDDNIEIVKAKINEQIHYVKTDLDKNGNLNSTDATENVTGIEFLVYDQYSHKERSSVKAEKEGEEFVAKIPAEKLKPGDELYVRVTTDRSHGIYSNTGNIEHGHIDEEHLKNLDNEMNQTIYSDVFTGYTFVQATQQEIPVVQSIDLPLKMEFDELPIVGACNFNFEFAGASVKTEKTDIGFRLSVGVNPVKMADKINNTKYSDFNSDTGKDYEKILKGKEWKNILKTMKQDIKDSKAADAKTQLGSPQWKFGVLIGVSFDFAYYSEKNPNTNESTDSKCVFTGVEGFLGASVGFKKAWYTIIPVVYIPAYFGVEIEGNILGTFGAGADLSKGEIEYAQAKGQTVDFNKSLKKLKGSIRVGADVQIYVGVGLAGTLGIRGGGGFEAAVLWKMSDKSEDLGAIIKFNLAITIDLIIYSHPFKYEFEPITYGSFSQKKENAKLMSSFSSTEESGFTVRQPYTVQPSEWLPDDIQLMSAFNEKDSKTLIENPYEHPDVQLIKMKNGSIFMAFLDHDMERGIEERTVLKYSVYKNGAWSEPKIVQEDKTGDFQPSICEIEDGKVMISWLSTDPNIKKTDEMKDYLSKLEVYTAVIDPETDVISEETCLTNDAYYDYNPICVYDEVTGDRAVYYVKSFGDESVSVEDIINPYSDTYMTYMLYSKEQGKWLFDYYYKGEVPDESQIADLIANWHGQRFLPSPVYEDDFSFEYPNIADFTAITYNGLAVYAYTIDPDSSNDTENDKEMFLQIYDFERHCTFAPIRITNDQTSDTLPQFVRTGSGESADTKLFWYRNGNAVMYIDVSDLIKNGIDEDGNIMKEYLTASDGTVQNLDSMYAYVAVTADNDESLRYMSDFKAIVDEDDIYVIWTQPTTVTDEEGNSKQCREIYATALIQQPDNPETEDSKAGCAWADPYRLTYAYAFIDEPNAIIDEKGNMMAFYNSYNQTITGDEENPVQITDFALKVSYMEPCGAVDVTEMNFSDNTPNPGDKVNVNIKVKNAGLTYADGYTINIYEMKNGVKGNLIENIVFDGTLLPGNINSHNFEWTTPADLDGTSLYAEAQEGSMTNYSEFESEKFKLKPDYVVDGANIYQNGNGYHIKCSVTNTGNAPSSAEDSLEILLAGPYEISYSYSKEECELAKIPFGEIGIGEQIMIDSDFNIAPELFEHYGYIDCFVAGKDKDGNRITEGERVRLMAASPLEVMLNGEQFPENIEMSAGETMEFDISCVPNRLNADLNVSLSSDDSGIVEFDGTKLIAVSEGTTTVHGVLWPYGTTTEDITITVNNSIPVVVNTPTVTETSFDYDLVIGETASDYDLYVALYAAGHTLLGVKKNKSADKFNLPIETGWALKIMMWDKNTMKPIGSAITYTAENMHN